MGRRTMWWFAAVWLASCVGCYYRPEHKRAKAHPSYLSEAEAEALIQRRLAPYGIKFITNMKLQREGVSFVADGYDRDLRIGFEYRSREGRDFADEPGGSPDGLTEAEIEVLRQRQDTFREYFLIIPEGTEEQVIAAVDRFVESLYEWEVLKRRKEAPADSLFPEKDAKKTDALPWEATGDLKKKREEMERREATRKAREQADEDAWATESGEAPPPGPARDDPKTKADPFADEADPPPSPKAKPGPGQETRPEPKAAPGEDDWGEEDEDF